MEALVTIMLGVALLLVALGLAEKPLVRKATPVSIVRRRRRS